MNDEIDRLVAAHNEELHRAPPHRVAQWHAAIDEAAALERGRSRERKKNWHPGSLFWGVAVTAALVLGIAIGSLRDIDDRRPDMRPDNSFVSTSGQSRSIPASFTRGLQAHLRDSRQRLVSLDESADTTMLVLQIIEQNRMFESVADRNNAPQLARVLRAFEPVLLELTAADTAPADSAALREQLAFELNVVLTKLADDSSNESHST